MTGLILAIKFVMPSGDDVIGALFLLAVLSLVAYLLFRVVKDKEPFSTLFYGVLCIVGAWWVLDTFTTFGG